MATVTHYPHIRFDAAGVAYIGDSRYKVLHLAAERYQYGWSAEEILKQHPDLRPEEVYAALTYFYDHFEELIATLNLAADTAAKTNPDGPVSRDELLKRKAARGQ